MTTDDNVRKPKKARVYYSRALALEICDRIAQGWSLRQIEEDPAMPNRVAIVQWANRDIDGFHARYMRARQMRASIWFEETIEIADDGRNDWMMREVAEGRFEPVCDKEHIARSRLRVETRKWACAKAHPELFADKLAVGHTVDPVEVNHTNIVKFDPEQLKALSLDELTRLYREAIVEGPAASQ